MLKKNKLFNYGMKSSSGIHIGGAGVIVAGGAPPAPVTYATWNPAALGPNLTLSNGDLTVTSSTDSTYFTVLATIAKTTGKWYWEYLINAINAAPGASALTFNVGGPTLLGQQPLSVGYRQSSGDRTFNNAGTWTLNAYGVSYAPGDTLGVAFDADAGTIIFYTNNVSQGVGYTIPANTGLTAATSTRGGAITANFGATPFTYAVPSGYNAGLYNVVVPVVFPQPASLVSYYKLQADGTDSKGSNTGTGTNMTYVDAKIGNGGDFTTSNFVNFGNTFNWEYTQPFTKSFWHKFTAASSDNHLISKQQGAGPNPGTWIGLQSGCYDCAIYTGSTNSIWLRTVSTWNDGLWHLVTVTWDGGTVEAGLNFYVDGLLRANQRHTYWTGPISGSILTSDSFQINGRWNSTNSTHNGVIDEVGIWNTALTASDITALYNGGAGITYP